MLQTPQCSALKSNPGLYLTAFAVFAIALLPVLTVGRPVRPGIEDCRWNSVRDAASHGLYFDDSEAVLASFRAKAKTTHDHIYQEIHSIASSFTEKLLPPADQNDFVTTTKWNAVYGIRLPLLSFYCLLKPDDHRAREHVFTMLDRITSYSLWRKRIPPDDLAVTHLLTGVATAFSFMKHQMNRTQKEQYLKYIFRVGNNIDKFILHAHWGEIYLHNHGVVHATALFHAALVLAPYCKFTTYWKVHTVLYFEKMMQMLDLVVDGSMNEGTGYGSYTVNCFTQFFYLAKRHMGRHYLNSVWARSYYEFMLGTTLPGYREIIGIGDSNRRWHSSPESQLVFWDTYILRNGEGNWLASKIRSARKEVGLESISWSEYTEYIWYDPSLGEKSPLEGKRKRSRLFRYSNAGMAVYNGGRDDGETFVSFKSGPLHGRAVYSAINDQTFPWLTRWESVNPGHEHPDANSFVFYPRGQPFITENFYTSKYSFLNNVLTFGPSALHSDYPPHSGQLGESKIWLKFRHNYNYSSNSSEPIYKAWSEVICAEEENGIAIFSGEAVHAYNDLLNLRSVYRVLILLNPNILLVVDHIELGANSSLKFTNAYFNNIDTAFEVLQPKGWRYPNAILKGEESSEIRWISWPHPPNHAKTGVFETREFHNNPYHMNYVNISVPLADITRVAYLFSSPEAIVDNLSFSNVTGDGVSVTVRTSNGTYTAMVATNYSHPSARLRYLGDLNYARVLKSSNPSGLLRELGDLIFSISNPPIISDQMKYYYFCLLFSWLLLSALCLKTHFTKFLPKRLVLLLLLFYMVTCAVLLLYNQDFPPSINTYKPEKRVDPLELLPWTAVYYLNGFGSSLSSVLFKHNKDFAHFAMTPNTASIPSSAIDAGLLLQACGSDTISDLDPLASKWIHRCFRSPEDIKLDLSPKVSYSNQMVVLAMQLAGWGSKLPQLFTNDSFYLPQNFRLIHIVSDPRTWVAHRMKWDVGAHLKRLLTMKKLNCPFENSAASEFDNLLSMFAANKDLPQHQLLAMYWEANAAASLILKQTLPPNNFVAIRYEDLMDEPVETAKKVYSFIGLPLPMSIEFNILQQTKSKLFRSYHPNGWLNMKLTEQQISDIVDICHSTMSQLGYYT